MTVLVGRPPTDFDLHRIEAAIHGALHLPGHSVFAAVHWVEATARIEIWRGFSSSKRPKIVVDHGTEAFDRSTERGGFAYPLQPEAGLDDDDDGLAGRERVLRIGDRSLTEKPKRQ